MSFPTVDALERELRRLESRQQILERSRIPAYPVEFAISLGIAPDEWQGEVLASNHPRKILCCGRQTGKSTVAAILAIHKALTCPGSTVLVVAPGGRIVQASAMQGDRRAPPSLRTEAAADEPPMR